MSDLIEQARRLSRPYRVEHGKRFRLKDVDPGDRGGLDAGDKPRALEALRQGVDAIAEPAGSPLRAGSLVAAARVPGHRRRRQGQRDQARDVGSESAGLPGLLVQVSVFRRPRP